jgi:hypothetical protein
MMDRIPCMLRNENTLGMNDGHTSIRTRDDMPCRWSKKTSRNKARSLFPCHGNNHNPIP